METLFQEPTELGAPALPQLYQESMMMADDFSMPPPPPPAEMSELAVPIEPTLITAAPEMPPPPPPPPPSIVITAPDQDLSLVRPMPRTISLELQRISEAKTKRAQHAVELAARRKRLIVDQKTKLTDAEMRRNIRLPAAENDQDLDEQEENINSLFRRSTSIYNRTKCDFLLSDLYKQPSGLIARRTDRVFTPRELEKSSLKCRLLMRNMVTSRQPDDTFFYLTEMGRRVREEQRTTEARPSEVSERSIEEARLGESRSAAETTAEVAVGEVSRARKRTLRESFVNIQATRVIEEEPVVVPALAIETEIPPPPMPMFDMGELPTMPQPEGPSVVHEQLGATTRVEVSVGGEEPEYEALLLRAVQDAHDENETLVLKDFINAAVVPDRLKSVKMPRRLFACKIFAASLGEFGFSFFFFFLCLSSINFFMYFSFESKKTDRCQPRGNVWAD
jgi:hypothetical protein